MTVIILFINLSMWGKPHKKHRTAKLWQVESRTNDIDITRTIISW